MIRSGVDAAWSRPVMNGMSFAGNLISPLPISDSTEMTARLFVFIISRSSCAVSICFSLARLQPIPRWTWGSPANQSGGSDLASDWATQGTAPPAAHIAATTQDIRIHNSPFAATRILDALLLRSAWLDRTVTFSCTPDEATCLPGVLY